MRILAKKNTKSAADKREFQNDLLLLLPILFIVTVFLFCFRAQLAPTHMEDFYWYTGESFVGDIYCFFREKVLLAVTIIACAILAIFKVTGMGKIHWHKVYIPMMVYFAFVMLSYFFSDYKGLALWGGMERYEGTVALVCYMLILFYAINAVRNEKNVALIVKCFAGACVILGIWGILQTMGIDLENLPKWLYVPAEMRAAASLNVQMDTKATTWFFTNQNYVSFFMVFPVCLFGMACISAEDKKKRMLYALLTCLMLFNLWQASSLSGMVGIAVSFVVALLLAGIENVKKWKKSLGLLFLAAVISVGASIPVIMREVNSGLNVTSKQIEEEKEFRFAEIDYILTEGKDFIFSFEGEEYKFETEDGLVKRIIDSKGAEVEEKNELFGYQSFFHEETGYQIMEISTAEMVWNFVVQNGQSYFIVNTGSCVKLDKTESIGFEGNEEFATNRGYIWSRTFPLLKDTILIGNGADTYSAYFPHDDFVGRYNLGTFRFGENTVYTKPHNMYLGAAVDTGMISLVALLAIYVIYMIESIKIYRKHTFASFKDYIGMGVCIAMAGFLVAGLVNDTMVQMMPVVYVLLGMGFAINRMLKEEK